MHDVRYVQYTNIYIYKKSFTTVRGFHVPQVVVRCEILPISPLMYLQFTKKCFKTKTKKSVRPQRELFMFQRL